MNLEYWRTYVDEIEATPVERFARQSVARGTHRA